MENQPGGVIDFDKGGGVVPVVAVDFTSGRLLMMAYMNREAFEETLATGHACYYSRSRGRLWRKGEESGNFQVVHEIRLDCDNDTLLLAVEQRGDQAACHEGYESCFFRKLDGSDWRIVDEHKVDPAKYGTNYGHHKTPGTP
ncbi:MAG TPA: phosphoribosyl-AMP cyclohydrolase [Candidatus Binataceae bacterium]|jgi:phosphoribosyl-AMP cyclohydrolase|nr:phosphoribosyl-AMP cyclohydrolase [Candidatus Binataceae bacterium]